MTKPKITLEEALQLVEFEQADDGSWRVGSVHGNVVGHVGGHVGGNVWGDVRGNVHGYVGGHVGGSVCGNVVGHVHGTINGKEWQLVETPREKLRRLIEEGADKDQLLEAFNQMEDNL